MTLSVGLICPVFGRFCIEIALFSANPSGFRPAPPPLPWRTLAPPILSNISA